jgi:hypothetical protein
MRDEHSKTTDPDVGSTRLVRRFIEETDWDAFWDRAVQRCEPGIEAYRQARLRSLSEVHVFMSPND